MINQYRRDTINKASSNQKTLAPKVIGRRQLLSTLALGSTAGFFAPSLLAPLADLTNGAGAQNKLAQLFSDMRANSSDSVGGTSVHDALFSPAAAQGETTRFTMPNRGYFDVDATNRIVEFLREFPTRDPTTVYWQEGADSGLLLHGVTNTGSTYPPYIFRDAMQLRLGEAPADAHPDTYLPDQIRPRTISTENDEDGSIILYPVTGLTGAQDAASKRVFVGFYAKHSLYSDWQFIPGRGGVPADLNLDVMLAVEGENDIETVVLFRIGTPSAVLTNFVVRTIPVEGFLTPATNLGAFDNALDALEFGTDETEVGDTNPLRVVLGLPTTTTTTEATVTEATVTEATVTVAPGPTTSTMEPTASTNVATTANATMEPTTTLVSTTVGAATMAPTTTLVSTTMAGTTLVSTTVGAATMAPTTTLVSPTIAGELSVRGAINAQGNIGANVARSLSGRLSSFRSRNRSRR